MSLRAVSEKWFQACKSSSIVHCWWEFLAPYLKACCGTYGIPSTSHQGIFPVSLAWITLRALHQQEPLSIRTALTRLATIWSEAATLESAQIGLQPCVLRSSEADTYRQELQLLAISKMTCSEMVKHADTMRYPTGIVNDTHYKSELSNDIKWRWRI